MPEFTCLCGETFAASKANARFCSDRCRKRAKRSGAEVDAAPVEPSGSTKVGAITEAAIRELTEAGRLDTSLGWTVVALARRLDNGFAETGSAYAALSKEFEVKMAAATRGVAARTAPGQLQDELAARRLGRGA